MSHVCFILLKDFGQNYHLYSMNEVSISFVLIFVTGGRGCAYVCVCRCEQWVRMCVSSKPCWGTSLPGCHSVKVRDQSRCMLSDLNCHAGQQVCSMFYCGQVKSLCWHVAHEGHALARNSAVPTQKAQRSQKTEDLSEKVTAWHSLYPPTFAS